MVYIEVAATWHVSVVFQDAESLIMKHQVTTQSELLSTKYFHTNKAMMYSINSQHNGYGTFGNEAKQARDTNKSHKMDNTEPQVHLCLIYALTSVSFFEVPSP